MRRASSCVSVVLTFEINDQPECGPTGPLRYRTTRDMCCVLILKIFAVLAAGAACANAGPAMGAIARETRA